jgi:hypothetical protein
LGLDSAFLEDSLDFFGVAADTRSQEVNQGKFPSLQIERVFLGKSLVDLIPVGVGKGLCEATEEWQVDIPLFY